MTYKQSEFIYYCNKNICQINIDSMSADDKCRGDNENKQEGWGVGEGFKTR